MIGQTNAIEDINIKSSINYVEYIESTGTQHIDTGVTVTGSTGFLIDMEYYAGARILGVANSSWGSGIVVTNEGACYRNGPSNAIDFTGDSNNFIVGERVLFSLINNIYTNIHGSTGTMVSTSFTSNGSLILFGLRYNGNVETNTRASIKLYGFKIYDGDTLIRDFKPVLDENNVACLYEEIEQKYYYNAGTGTFNAGSVI